MIAMGKRRDVEVDGVDAICLARIDQVKAIHIGKSSGVNFGKGVTGENDSPTSISGLNRGIDRTFLRSGRAERCVGDGIVAGRSLDTETQRYVLIDMFIWIQQPDTCRQSHVAYSGGAHRVDVNSVVFSRVGPAAVLNWKFQS